MNESTSRRENLLLRIYNKAKSRENAPRSINDDTQDQLVNRCCISCKNHSSILLKVEKQVGEILISVS
jgi:hypothetical protein